MDKLICKRLLEHHGFPQVNFCQVGEPGWREQAAAMGMPDLGQAVAPRLERRDHTACMSAEQELDDAVELALRHDPRVIVEAHCEGREVECSVIGNTEPEASLPGEISTQGAEWYDYEAKYTDGGMELVVPAPIGDDAIERVREARRRGLPRARLPRTRPLRLLRHRGRRGAGERDQHDPRLHGDERLRKALRGDGRARTPSSATVW